MATDLDALDRQLLSLLRANGRESVASLAKRLGVTRATVNAHITKLVDRGVIVGFSVRVRDPADTSTVRAITLVAVERRNTNANIRDLAAFDRALLTIRDISGIRDSETSILLSTATA